MLVALVFVVGFVVLVVLPPAFLAVVLRLFAAPPSEREMPCRPAPRSTAATLAA